MRLLIILLCLNSLKSLSQTDYDIKLMQRLDQIRKLKMFNNKIVVSIDSVDYNDADPPYWKRNVRYYEGDIVRWKNCEYEALMITKLVAPDVTKIIWKVRRGPHPYLFLRDTATVEDLRKYLSDENAYVRIYSFAALSFRNASDLFPVLRENLTDNTEIVVYTGHSTFNAFPADLMTEYQASLLTAKEKKRLKKLLPEKFPYLKRALSMLDR